MKYRREKVIEIPILPEDYFESNYLKTAVWQYLIDHAKPLGNGRYRIFFYIADEDDFWRRVKARKDGRYRRNDFMKMRDKLSKEEYGMTRIKNEYRKATDSKLKRFIYRLLLRF